MIRVVMKSLRDQVVIALVLLLGAVFIARWDVKQARALSNPLQSGTNLAVTASSTATKVATGQNCSVTFVNLSATPVYTGYTGVTSSTGIPVCNDATLCIATWVTRDAVPGALYYRTASGTASIRLELGAGCVSP